MPRRLHQALIALAALAASAGAAAPPAAADTAAPRACRAQLAAECDGLLAAAVKTPYGWGWTGGGVASGDATTGRASRPARTRAAGPVTIDTRASAAAGLALHLAGGRLGEAKYQFAALQAARVVAAVQSHTGQVPAGGIIRANAGGNDEPALVPSRAATCASLALWLTLLHDAESSPGSDAAQVRSLRPAALKAANWLASQQTKLGGWPVEFVAVPSAPSAGAARGAARNPRAIRLIRLDRPDARDATFCLWLAASVLDDAKLRRRAEAAVEELSVLRIAEEKSPGRNLWSAAYNLDETPAKAIEDLPYGVDLAAADHALQALLAASLLGDGDAAAPVLRQATAALAQLPRHDGKWLRYYSISEGATPTQPVQPAEAGAAAPPETQVFDPGPDAKADSEPTAPPGLSLTVAAVARLAELGPAKYVEALAATVPVEHRLAMAICGLDEDALANEIPADPKGIEEYLERHRERFAVLGAPPPDDLGTRVQRLGLLLRRVQIEALRALEAPSLR